MWYDYSKKRPRMWRKNGILARDKRRIRLAERAVQIVSLSASGSTPKAVAQRLGISDDTVRQYVNDAVQRTAELTQKERNTLARLPAPAAVQSPRWRALQLRLGGGKAGAYERPTGGRSAEVWRAR